MGRSRASPLPPNSPPTFTEWTRTCACSTPMASASIRRVRKGSLVGRPDLDAAVRIDGQEPGVGLQVSLVAGRHAEGVLQSDVGFAEAPFHVALAPGEAGEAVAQVGRQALVRRSGIAGDVIVQQRRSRIGGGHGIEHRRQDFVVPPR